jgi:hypothetical protein
VFRSAEVKEIAASIRHLLNFLTSAPFSRARVPELFVTTFLIYAAALLVSFIVLVIVAFVYVIMNEDDKDDQHKH